MIPSLLPFCIYLRTSLNKRIKQWTRSAPTLIGAYALADLTRNRTDLVVENSLLHQHLIILNRQIKRSKLTNSDRICFDFLARLTNYWLQALHIVQPNTLRRWHRDLFRLY